MLLNAQTPRTMRLDYYHTGDAKSEVFSLDRVVLEPLPWPGNPRHNLDNTDLGKYFFEVRDKASGSVLYSRGFASVFGEWESTDEAQSAKRTFSESLRFPAPAAPVRIVLSRRDENNHWREVWQTMLDPNAMTVDRAAPPSAGPLITIENNGPSAEKVDFLILGDGYTAGRARQV